MYILFNYYDKQYSKSVWLKGKFPFFEKRQIFHFHLIYSKKGTRKGWIRVSDTLLPLLPPSKSKRDTNEGEGEGLVRMAGPGGHATLWVAVRSSAG